MPRDLPPRLSDLLNRLHESGRSFIDLYEDKEERMRAIASNLGEISEDVTDMQQFPHATRTLGAVVGGVGVVGAAAALFSGGRILTFGGTLALGGGVATVIATHVMKVRTEKIIRKKVEKLGNEFMTIIELQTYDLERIKEVSEELEEKSSALMTKTKAQAKNILLSIEQLQQQIIPTANEQKNFINCIADIALHCQNTVNEFAKMREMFKDFGEM